MSETTPKPGLLGFADSPEDAARKLAASIDAGNAANAAVFGDLFAPPPPSGTNEMIAQLARDAAAASTTSEA
jgi:hypothetical protein